jgi:hypothetical protein
MYRRWSDESILTLADHRRAAFSEKIGEINQRALRDGYAKEVDGRVRPNARSPSSTSTVAKKQS